MSQMLKYFNWSCTSQIYFFIRSILDNDATKHVFFHHTLLWCIFLIVLQTLHNWVPTANDRQSFVVQWPLILLRPSLSFLAHLSRRSKFVRCPVVVVVVVVAVVVNFLRFHLLLQNHWANFSQSWHKSYLGKGNLKLFKWRALLFSKGR